MIEIQNIFKQYPNRPTAAVNGISFSIKKGEVLGLLGTNGAGKTTTISILCGLLKPDSGSVLINGSSDLNQLKTILGVVPQDIALYPSLTVKENLNFFGAQYKLGKEKLSGAISYWAEKLQITDLLDYRISNLSGGQKRKTNLAAALLHRPQFLILDEPTVGVDIHSRQLILDVLQQLNEEGLTILYTSHYMEEAEKLCDRVIILNEGKILAEGSPEELSSRYGFSGELDRAFLLITQKK